MSKKIIYKIEKEKDGSITIHTDQKEYKEKMLNMVMNWEKEFPESQK